MSRASPDLSLTTVLKGSVLILISNLVYIGHSYLVAWTQLQAPEIAFVRGIFQIVIFGAIIWRGRQDKKEEKPGNFFRDSKKEYRWIYFRTKNLSICLVRPTCCLWSHRLNNEFCLPCSYTTHAYWRYYCNLLCFSCF